MSTVCPAKKIETKTTHSSKREKGRLRRMKHTKTNNKQTQSLPSKRERLLWSLWKKGQQQRRD
jgi:hypothetical protein